MASFPEYLLGDERLNERARYCFEQLSSKPDESFPKVFPILGGGLEGFYRFIHNPRVQLEDLVRAAVAHTITRLPKNLEVLALHDTTKICLGSRASKIEEFSENKGFEAHVTLIVDNEFNHRVVGLGGLTTFCRQGSFKPNNERDRWLNQTLRVDEALSEENPVIHVMDREGDICSNWSELLTSGARFVIRIKHDRWVKTEEGVSKTYEMMRTLPSKITQKIQLSKRTANPCPSSAKKHPSRDARETVFRIVGKSLDVYHDKKKKEASRINVVAALEEEGEIEWFLLTTEPIETEADLLRVIDIYKARWTIEEFFKGLKTGCHIEEKLLEDASSWKKLIAFYAPICSNLLNLRAIARTDGKRIKQNDKILSENQWKILKLKARKRKVETYQDAYREIALLGGHIKYNGPPGWLVLLRGYLDLLKLEEGWSLSEQTH